VRPACHSWEIVCDRHGSAIDEQIVEVLDRLRPVREQVKRVLSDYHASGVLQVVRYLGVHIANEEGEEDEEGTTVTEEGRTLVKLHGQHLLLEWHLDASVLELLADIGAEVDADEYG
jgi:hypothetical protein